MEDVNDESLREAACTGDYAALKRLLEGGIAQVNSKNKVNRWTALHWASKRGHTSLVKMLLNHGADPSIVDSEGRTALQVTSSQEVAETLGGQPSLLTPTESLPIVPNYLQKPVFPYSSDGGDARQENKLVVDTKVWSEPKTNIAEESPSSPRTLSVVSCVLTVKARIAEDKEKDFVEVDLSSRSYEDLLQICCQELDVPVEDVQKIRKLPNVIIRKDKDVERCKTGQEFELVLHTHQ